MAMYHGNTGFRRAAFVAATMLLIGAAEAGGTRPITADMTAAAGSRDPVHDANLSAAFILDKLKQTKGAALKTLAADRPESEIDVSVGKSGTFRKAVNLRTNDAVFVSLRRIR
jgi:hypothetical protein